MTLITRQSLADRYNTFFGAQKTPLQLTTQDVSITLQLLQVDAITNSTVSNFFNAIVTAPNTIGIGTSWKLLAFDFDVNSQINVTSLGLFSSGSASSVPSGESIRVQIFQRTSSDSDILQSNTAIADLFFTSSSTVTLFSGFLYQSLTPVTLNPGSFTCVASGFGSGFSYGSNQLGNQVIQDTGNGLITFRESRQSNVIGPAANFIGSRIESTFKTQFLAGSFQFSGT